MREADKLEALLTHFTSYERVEVRDFRQAIEHFKADLPTIVETLRNTLATQAKTNKPFRATFKGLLTQCQESINPTINAFDIREMIIQHILTEDIFLTVFNEAKFHQENVVARHLETVVNTFFTGKLRRDTLKSIESYYAVIRREAANISNHHEKQKFLKVIYENFYKTYNPKAADRLGIVYTPNEIVRFMIESTDYLLDKHFNRLLADDQVEILDPATGTGTFITELIEYLPKNGLHAKYLKEIHGNEVAILPYYIANLNIEYTYQQKMGEYEAFSHICFVDTLDNLGFEHSYQNQQKTLSLGLGEENAARIRAQNKHKISVIIGNPPYNANQQNENDNNKNRIYPEIDEAIKRTYIANSTVTNSSFLDARTFDGFRKVVAEEFNEIYLVDLGGDVRKNPKLSGTKNNVFGIQTGVAISFMVKRQGATSCKIYYVRRPEMEIATDKLAFLRSTPFKEIEFERIMPDKNHHWLNIVENDFDDLLALVAGRGRKLGKTDTEKSVFELFSFGVVTNRDDWVYDFSKLSLIKKVNYLLEQYHLEKVRLKGHEFKDEELTNNIKWTQDLKKYLRKNIELQFNETLISDSIYRPYVRKKLYFCKFLNWSHYQMGKIFCGEQNLLMTLSGASSHKPFSVLATNRLYGLDFLEKTQCLPFYRYENGEKIENLTDWGLNKFRTHYLDESITKADIFHYTYAVLHHPAYREKYALNLKREFPRLPFYDDFHQWATWGKQLMVINPNSKRTKRRVKFS